MAEHTYDVAIVGAGIAGAILARRLASAGAETVSPERARPGVLRAHLKAEIDKWVPLIRKAGVTAD